MCVCIGQGKGASLRLLQSDCIHCLWASLFPLLHPQLPALSLLLKRRGNPGPGLVKVGGGPREASVCGPTAPRPWLQESGGQAPASLPSIWDANDFLLLNFRGLGTCRNHLDVESHLPGARG